MQTSVQSGPAAFIDSAMYCCKPSERIKRPYHIPSKYCRFSVADSRPCNRIVQTYNHHIYVQPRPLTAPLMTTLHIFLQKPTATAPSRGRRHAPPQPHRTPRTASSSTGLRRTQTTRSPRPQRRMRSNSRTRRPGRASLRRLEPS